MKKRYVFAALLAAVFLISMIPVQAEENPDFTLDELQVLKGMDRSWLQGYEPSVFHDTLTVVLPILSARAEGEIQTELILPDIRISPFKPQILSVTTPRSGSGTYPVTLKLALFPDRKNGDYACTLRITGKDKAGEPLRTDLPWILRIRDGAPNPEAARILISEVQSDLELGEDGAVTAKLTNPCKTVTFERVALRISDGSGEIIPQAADVLYLPDMQPGESVDIVFPMTVLNKASVSPHPLKFDLNYQTMGQAAGQTESYTVDVKQEIRLEQGGLKMASSVIAGDPVTMTLPLMNMGKAEVINTLATLSLPGIAERQSVLVGTISPGDTKNAQITFSPGKDLSGEFEGTVSVETTDDDGNPASFILPVHLTVEKPAVKEAAVDLSAPEIERIPVATCALGGSCCLLLLGLILQGILLRKKIRRLEEEKL